MNDKVFICLHCGIQFTRKFNLLRHEKTNCTKLKIKRHEEKVKIFEQLKLLEFEKNILQEENIKLKEENKKLKNSTTNTINVTGNINNTNNIMIVQFGKEDVSKIKQKEIIKALNRGFMAPVGLTETIHFNPKYPEYHNVYIPSMKEKYAMIYDGSEWKLVNKSDLVDQIYDEKRDFISENFDEFYDSLTSSKRNALKEWFDMEENDDKIKQIKEDLKLLLYNKRKIVQKR
jgi:hypothetical protein